MSAARGCTWSMDLFTNKLPNPHHNSRHRSLGEETLEFQEVISMEEATVSEHTGPQGSTAAHSASATASRRARRSSCLARIIVGASDDIRVALQEDDRDFFGDESDHSPSNAGSDSEAEASGEDVEPQAKRPCTSDVWSDVEEVSPVQPAVTGVASDEEQVPAVTLQDINNLLSTPCGCTKSHYDQFEANNVLDFRKQQSSLTGRELDLYLLGSLSAEVKVDEAAAHSDSRSRAYFGYRFVGKPVCRTAFMKLHGIGGTRLKRLQGFAAGHSCNPDVHGNVGRTPWNAFPEEVRQKAIEFVQNYAKVNGLPMPAAPRGRGEEAPTYLPASETYRSVHQAYKDHLPENEQCMGYQAFVALWHAKAEHCQVYDSQIRCVCIV